ncbi:MAG: hypothetical protein R8M45_00505 [Ghiorsea sp.]
MAVLGEYFKTGKVIMVEYATAQLWREAAMQRQNLVSMEEEGKRRAQALLHYAKEAAKPDDDTLADHALYILGKMEVQEYEQYLLFKHGQQAA